ncbi:MAG: TMEM165/GDT1 family protein [Micropepsaceae bacterium]
MLDAFLTSSMVVAFAEIGDKTQLLAIILATRFRKPLPVVCGIFFATIANHFLAALAGSAVAGLLEGFWFRCLVGASFVAMAIWTLVPDSMDGDTRQDERYGAFTTTLIAFFLVEMGDKTQVATVALGARFHDVIAVTMGTTIGMMIANVPAVFVGHELLQFVPLKVVRFIAAALFLIIGGLILAQATGLV